MLTSSIRNMTALTLSVAFLTACASTPPTSTLLTGISAADLAAKPANVDVNGLRLATDPVCAQFYENSVAFANQSSGPNPASQFFAATGISVLAAVATNGLLGGGSNSVGDIAARSATSQVIAIGGNAALTGLNSNRPADKKIITQAKSINCPVGVG